METIRGYEQDLSSTCAEITQLTGSLRLASTQPELEQLAAQLDQLFTDARETLEQMELESHGLEPGSRKRIQLRLSSYSAELVRQEDQVRLSKTEAGHRRDRLELFTRDGGEFEGGENSLLLQETDEMLSSAGRQLQDGRRLLAETEEVGAGVLGSLHGQRETLERSRSRLKDVEAGLGQSSSLLGTMLFRAQQNRLVLGLVLAAVLLVLAWGSYRLATS